MQWDCCEDTSQCGNPNLVNPGAYEFPGNSVDDDCDGTVDNAVTACDTGLTSNSANGLDYAKAIDLCQTTTENPPIAQKKWGVISATFYRANGAGTPAANSRSIRSGYGSGVTPLLGQKLAALSTEGGGPGFAQQHEPGLRRVPGRTEHGHHQPGALGLAERQRQQLPERARLSDPQGGTTANDPIMLKLRIRVPTNAKSFNVSSFFYSSEYPEWVCSAFNDFFLTLLDSSFVPGPGRRRTLLTRTWRSTTPAPPSIRWA